jgi:hypothetical protein
MRDKRLLTRVFQEIGANAERGCPFETEGVMLLEVSPPD